MPKRQWRRAETAIVVVVVLLVAGMYMISAQPGKARLVVWSCGGNYHSLSAFSEAFEKCYDCRVQYTAAPIQYLLEYAAFEGGQPDILVGRSGPGWAALEKLDRLADGPDFFGADPYVIITPDGNPANIDGIAALGRAGVRVAYSPHAMRPKGKCPSHLMGMVSKKFFPGLNERWENNAVSRAKCGRDLPQPVMNGKADAAIVARSMIAYPTVNEQDLEVVPIAMKHLNAMKVCRATIGQCIAILKGAREPELARKFRDALVGKLGRRIMSEYGYIHITDPKVHRYDPFLTVFRPKRMPPWQVRLADMLAEAGITGEAVRRYLKVIHTFGPNSLEAYCRFRVGKLLAERGELSVAADQYERLIENYPRTDIHEWGSPVFKLVSNGPKLKLQPPAHYVELGSKKLRKLQQSVNEEPRDELVAGVSCRPPQVIDGDPPKNGTREFALAEDLFLVKNYRYASRDYLKVLHLCYPSRYRPQASFKLGMCDYKRDNAELAASQWCWTIDTFPDTEAARKAATALEGLGAAESVLGEHRGPVSMPSWEPKYNTWPQRGMTYGMALYKHRLPLFTLKEMFKLMHNVYKKAKKLKPQIRYRAGIAAWEADHPRAAVFQWRMCRRDYPHTEWAAQSAAAIRAVTDIHQVTPQQARRVRAAREAELPKIPMRNKPACWQRFCLGQDFFQVGIGDEGQAAMEFMKALTVTRASKSKYDESVVPKAEKKLSRSLALFRKQTEM